MAITFDGHPRAVALRRLACRGTLYLMDGKSPVILSDVEIDAVVWATLLIDDVNPKYVVTMRNLSYSLPFETYAED